MNNIIGGIFIGIGLAFTLIGAIGVIRFPDIYTRLQAATKCVTLGTCGLLVGVMVIAGMSPLFWKCFICMVFLMFTTPTAAHALARSSHAFGIKLWDKSVINQYDGDNADTTLNKEPT